MYRVEDSQLSVYDFVPPFSGSLDRNNRWVRLAEALDWPALEKAYAGNFAAGGKEALPVRLAFGSLVIRKALNLSDQQTMLLIRESPYLQYFIGLTEFQNRLPFAVRSLRTFRQRIPAEAVNRAVRLLAQIEREDREETQAE